MADTLYLSLWYPNLRLAGLAEKLTAVLQQFAAHGGEPRVYAATTWPIGWTESPIFQRVFGAGPNAAQIEQAVEETLELLHDDYAYEFQIGWSLWEVESVAELQSASGEAGPSTSAAMATSAQDDHSNRDTAIRRWVKQPRLVRVTGYGPLFDEGAYEQDGHVRIDFGSDAAFLQEDTQLDSTAARHVEENIRQLVELAAAVEKSSGATARILWSELGESLAQRLAARLGALNH